MRNYDALRDELVELTAERDELRKKLTIEEDANKFMLGEVNKYRSQKTILKNQNTELREALGELRVIWLKEDAPCSIPRFKEIILTTKIFTDKHRHLLDSKEDIGEDTPICPRCNSSNGGCIACSARVVSIEEAESDTSD